VDVPCVFWKLQKNCKEEEKDYVNKNEQKRKEEKPR
jgi:hypothetical protein